MGSGQQRSGTFNVTLGETTHAVIFDTPMPDETYQLLIQPTTSVGAGVSVAIWPSQMTANGFTLNLSVGVNATFSYLAVASQ